jgi:predicted deacetylase
LDLFPLQGFVALGYKMKKNTMSLLLGQEKTLLSRRMKECALISIEEDKCP